MTTVNNKSVKKYLDPAGPISKELVEALQKQQRANEQNNIFRGVRSGEGMNSTAITRLQDTDDEFRKVETLLPFNEGKYNNELFGTYIGELQKNLLKLTGKFTDNDFASVGAYLAAMNRYLLGENPTKDVYNYNSGFGRIKEDNKLGNQTLVAHDTVMKRATAELADKEYFNKVHGHFAEKPYVSSLPRTTEGNIDLKNITRPTNIHTQAIPFNRADTRRYLRNLNINPYSLSGAQRREFRKFLNSYVPVNPSATSFSTLLPTLLPSPESERTNVTFNPNLDRSGRPFLF